MNHSINFISFLIILYCSKYTRPIFSTIAVWRFLCFGYVTGSTYRRIYVRSSQKILEDFLSLAKLDYLYAVYSLLILICIFFINLWLEIDSRYLYFTLITKSGMQPWLSGNKRGSGFSFSVWYIDWASVFYKVGAEKILGLRVLLSG